jgi:hypothetical protein
MRYRLLSRVFLRVLIANLRNPLSERDRFLFLQLDGNLRLGQSGQHHEDLSGIQVELTLLFLQQGSVLFAAKLFFTSHLHFFFVFHII